MVVRAAKKCQLCASVNAKLLKLIYLTQSPQKPMRKVFVLSPIYI